MYVTKHAAERWALRFPGRDLQAEYARTSRNVGRKTRRRIRESCPRHAAYAKASNRGHYYRQTPEGIVFVMAPPETLITVLDLRPDEEL